jgi:SAM-dependent methyltransferase
VGTFQDWISETRFSDASWREVLEDKGGDSWLRRLEFVRCSGCGFIWVSPAPNEADLAAFYRQYRGTTSYAAKRDKKIRRSLRRIRKLAKQVPGRRFLDVGCNVGFAVEAARLAGFTATGVDVDPHAVSLARAQFPEASFHAGAVEAMVETGETFDLVHCSRPAICARSRRSDPAGGRIVPDHARCRAHPSAAELPGMGRGQAAGASLLVHQEEYQDAVRRPRFRPHPVPFQFQTGYQDGGEKAAAGQVVTNPPVIYGISSMSDPAALLATAPLAVWLRHGLCFSLVRARPR